MTSKSRRPKRVVRVRSNPVNGGEQVSTMPMNRRGISAAQLARDYAVSLNEFADDVVNLLNQLDASQVSADAAERCRESCAAVWGGMVVALESSSLSKEEREQLT